MSYEKIMDAMKNVRNGVFFRIAYKSEMPIKAEFKKQGISIVKVVETTCRAGVSYPNIKGVVINDTPNTKKNNYSWVLKDKVCYNDNTNKYYVRIAPIFKGNNKNTKYIINGEVVEKMNDEQKAMINDYYWNKSSVASYVQNVSFDNIISIGKTCVED